MPRYTPARSLRGKDVLMDGEGTGVVWPYKFVRWVRTPMYTDGPDTNDIGVGALVYVPWRCAEPFNKKPPCGFKKGHFILRPYWDLYRTKADHRNRRPIQRPPVNRVRMFRDSERKIRAKGKPTS